MEENKKEEKKKLNIKERWKDKRERAKIELMLYGIFFLAIIIFARISSSFSYSNIPKDNNIKSFINDITDNYQYDIDITIDNNNYKYYGSKLGHNMDITRVVDNKEDYFYQMNDKYYILDTKGNYILTNDSDIFPYIEYRYLDINNIKEYIKLATYNDNIYSIKVSDIVLNSNSSDVITIKVDEDNKNIIIDYTNLFKIDNNKTRYKRLFKNLSRYQEIFNEYLEYTEVDLEKGSYNDYLNLKNIEEDLLKSIKSDLKFYYDHSKNRKNEATVEDYFDKLTTDYDIVVNSNNNKNKIVYMGDYNTESKYLRKTK